MGELEKKEKRRLLLGRRGADGSLAPFGPVYLALLGLGTVGALAVYLLLIAFVPGASGTRLDAMKTALLVVAGSGAGAGLYVQYRKQHTDEAKSALDHANSRRDQDKLFTERYTVAVAQLGNAAAAVRLGGVYALARIADDSERDRPTCLKVLCAYLRMPYDPDDAMTEPAERQVRATAQAAIAERLQRDHSGFWANAQIDLAGAYLIELQFDRISVDSFKAAGATFSGETRFARAIFDLYAGFSGATFSSDVWFGDAIFGGYAGFDEATFAGNAGFSDTTFNLDARFSNATFGGYAGFNDAKFEMSTGFDGATFNQDAGFDGARVVGNTVFSRATFSGNAWFGGVTFGVTFDSQAFFDGARFCRDHPPAWPAGFAEPTGIVWVDRPDPDPGLDPGPSLAADSPTLP